MNHSFDIEHARLYGLPEAIILHNVLFWLAHNKAFGRNIREGKPWTFNSVVAYSKLFPYFTPNKIRRYFESLEEQKVLLVGNFNQKKYDKTKWHTVADQSMIPVFGDPLANSPKARMPNGNGESAEPIPDINTDGKQRESDATAWTPQPKFKQEKSKAKAKDYSHIEQFLGIIKSIDEHFTPTKELKNLIAGALKRHDAGTLCDAIHGRKVIKGVKPMAWRYLFSNAQDWNDALDAHAAERRKILDMRARFNPEPAKMTPEDMAAIEKSISAI